MKYISLLGSTGSIGTSTLSVVSQYPTEFGVRALAAQRNITLLEKQARIFRPRIVSVWEEDKAAVLKKKLSRLRIKVVSGLDGLREVACLSDVSMSVFALNGMNGLVPLFDAMAHKKDIAIANKELLVIAGPLIQESIKEHGIRFVPIDSEHSAIFQCLEGHGTQHLKKIILTASGGPFVDSEPEALQSVTPAQALNHPRWKMGKKISIDSATMMNKGLEVIEASFLYGVDVDDIEVIVHRESIIHSLVEFIDGSVLAQLSNTDMRFPILYALTYPDRLAYAQSPLKLSQLKTLSFEEPRKRMFPCLQLAYKACRAGGTMPAVLNAANEVAVEKFLHGTISFVDIPRIINKTMNRHSPMQKLTMTDILAVDRWAREEAERICYHLS